MSDIFRRLFVSYKHEPRAERLYHKLIEHYLVHSNEDASRRLTERLRISDDRQYQLGTHGWLEREHEFRARLFEQIDSEVVHRLIEEQREVFQNRITESMLGFLSASALELPSGDARWKRIVPVRGSVQGSTTEDAQRVFDSLAAVATAFGLEPVSFVEAEL